MRFFARCLLLRKLFYRTPPARTTRQVGRAHMAYSLRVGSYGWAQFCKYYVFDPQPQPPYFARWTCLPACLGGEKFVARVTGAYPLGALNFQKNPRREPRRDPLPGDCNGTANGDCGSRRLFRCRQVRAASESGKDLSRRGGPRHGGLCARAFRGGTQTADRSVIRDHPSPP